MAKIEGVAKKFDGTAIDYVSIFNWEDGKCVTQIKPDASGVWEYSRHTDLLIGITYVADGCQPITHGSYQYQYTGSENLIINGHFDNDLSGWTNGGGHYKWVSGRAHHPRGTSYNVLSQSVINKGLVRVTATIEVVSGKALYFMYSSQAGYLQPLVELSIGTHNIELTSQTNGDSYFGVGRVSSTGEVEFYVDNVVIVKV